MTRVPFGRAGVRIISNDAPSRELSHGHGLEDAYFHGVFKSWDFHDLGLLPKLQSGITAVRFGRITPGSVF